LIAIVDQLDILDGKEVTPSERIQAKQNLEPLTVDLYTRIELKRMENERKQKENEEKKTIEPQEQVNDSILDFFFILCIKSFQYFFLL